MIEPAQYARWRNSSLGGLTEGIELAAIFELAGDIRGKYLLDLGCGDGTYSIRAFQRGAHVVGLDKLLGTVAQGARLAGLFNMEGCPLLDPGELRQLLQQAGFQVIATRGASTTRPSASQPVF